MTRTTVHVVLAVVLATGGVIAEVKPQNRDLQPTKPHRHNG